jgi:arginyl-tRNA synthetase
MPTLLQEIESAVSSAIAGAFPEAAGADPLVTAATDAKFGDYQCNAAMGLAKRLGKKPRDVAGPVAERLAASPLFEKPEIAGPGFINLRLRRDAVEARLSAAYADDRLGVEKASPAKTFVIDFSSPNVAKPMHVGHIRSTIIGDSLAKLLGFLGHRVITDNHIGDWGTQFGMLIVGYRRFLKPEELEKDPIEELVRIYRVVSGFTKYIAAIEKLTNPNLPPKDQEEQRKVIAAHRDGPYAHINETQMAAILDEAKAELVKLQRGDPDNLALWRRFIDLSMREFEKIYARLGVRFDHVLGESFYNPMLQAVVDDLKAKGLAVQSEGAWCVFPKGPGLPDSPFIVQKSDGAFNYASTDLATIRHRVETFKADSALYVVGTPQADHFKQLFATAKMWGYDRIDLRHIEFGSVLGEDGKLLRTRSGDTVKLSELLDEAEERATAIVNELRPDLPEEERKKIGTAVGVAAVKYADLMQNRSTDYKFSMAKMVALEGNTAPYLMMQYVRCRSIFRKSGTTPEEVRASASAIRLEHPTEQALAKHVLRLPDALRLAAAECRPNFIAAFLYELSEKYSAFFRDCPVIQSEGETRLSRLRLCDLVARTLRLGLSLLGIPTVEQM